MKCVDATPMWPFTVKGTKLTTSTIAEQTVTLKSGQIALFDADTKNLIPVGNQQKETFSVYGVDVPTQINPELVLLGDFGMARQDVTVNYSIEPQGAGTAGYTAQSAQIDLFAGDCADQLTDPWVGSLIGNAKQGAGQGVYSRGSIFSPSLQYCVQLVLNRGTSAEIRGTKVKLQTLYADLDIDSDNSAGWQADGTHNPPSRNPLEEQIEALAGQPGKVMRPNFLDVDGDKVPGYADGFDRNDQEGDGASASFYPIKFSIAGRALDLNHATVKFDYSGSDPAAITPVIAADSTVSYPLPQDGGVMRLWTKDGQFSRNAKDVADGGDYLTPGMAYPLNLIKDLSGLFVEGIRGVANEEEKKITLKIDPDGPGPLPQVDGDQVFATPIYAALVPDHDHNRVIDEKDRARAELGDTYYFWINDDDDSGETGGNDIPIDNTYLHGDERDYFNNDVDGVRDLIDFFPVAFDLKSLALVFPVPRYKYRLRADDEQVNLLFPGLNVSSVGNYLVDVPTAKRLTEKLIRTVKKDGDFKASFAERFALTFQQRLDALIAQAAANTEPSVLLFEGNKKSTKPLVLDVLDESDQKVFSVQMNLSLDGVEQMFRHKNLITDLRNSYDNQSLPDHEPVPEAGMPDRGINGDDGFGNKAHFAGFDAESDENNFVHVHGYNINGQAARGEQSEAFKRLYWSGSRAKFWGITWYGWESQWTSLERTPNYHVNVRHALNTGRLLKDFVNQTVTNNVTVFAHSLGNMMVSSAIGEGMTVAHYLMVNAAVADEAYTPQEVYDGGATYESGVPWRSATREPMYHPAWRYPDGVEIDFEQGYSPKLWASEWYKLFGTDDDRSTLTWRNRFAKVRDMTDTYVYYATTDEAFRPFLYTVEMAANNADYQSNVTDWPGVEEVIQNAFNSNNLLGAYAFALQELLKGRGGISDSGVGGWGFNLQDGYQFLGVHVRPAVANSYPETRLMAKPFFLKNSDSAFLYVDPDPPVPVSTPQREELLANEIPALTNAAGHRGVGKIRTERNIDIRRKFAVDKPWWPRGTEKYEWRHSDVYNVAYTYLSGLYDEWVEKIKGVSQ